MKSIVATECTQRLHMINNARSTSTPSTTAGKNLEYGLKEEGLLKFVRELNGNEEEPYNDYLRDASMYARGKCVVLAAVGLWLSACK